MPRWKLAPGRLTGYITAEFIDAAGILDMHNKGLIGFGHCDDNDEAEEDKD